MAYVYRHFIAQNVAPKGAKNIVVYNSNNEKVMDIPLGGLTPPNTQKLYSFGLVSDVHLHQTTPTWQANNKLDSALSYFESQGCTFCTHCGDLVNEGFYIDINGSTQYSTGQWDMFSSIRAKHNIPIYGICGNHESYGKEITNNLTELKTYTGTDLYYSITQGNDLYVFLGQPKGTIPMTDEALQWCYETLEANRNKRCFVFVHPYITNDSGNALNAYSSNPIFDWWGTKTTAFKNLLCHYKNTILFHGHSHFMFECQELDDTANYTEKNGFRSVHIPSLSIPCAIVDGVRTSQNDKSYGYIADVYEDCIVLNGIDLINNIPVPLGTFKIDTPLQTIAPNTFTDSARTIVT